MAGEAQNIYQRHPLNLKEFRLLYVEFAQHRPAPLVCRLEAVSLEVYPKYFTLSYAWGSLEETVSLQVDDKTLRVSSRVDKALRHIRALKARRVWIDQVCINQMDVNERNAQILLMKDIYSRSRECFVYLGERSGSSSDLQWLLDYIKASRGGRLWEKGHGLRDDRFQLSRFPDGQPPWRKCMLNIMEQSYFTRLWVLQELHFSGVVTCLMGNSCFDWDVIQACAQEIPIWTSLSTNSALRNTWWSALLYSKFYEIPLLFGNNGASEEGCVQSDTVARFSSFVDTVQSLNQGQGQDQGLMTLLLNSRHLDSTDERDKIFALLNLASDQADFPSPDYSIEVVQTYKCFARVFEGKGNQVELLSFSGIQITPEPWPSWVPKWSESQSTFNYQSSTMFEAGGIDRSSPPEPCTTGLAVRVKVYDDVKYALSCIQQEGQLLSRLANFVSRNVSELQQLPPWSGWPVATLEHELVDLLFCELSVHKRWSFRDHLSNYKTRKEGEKKEEPGEESSSILNPRNIHNLEQFVLDLERNVAQWRMLQDHFKKTMIFHATKATFKGGQVKNAKVKDQIRKNLKDAIWHRGPEYLQYLSDPATHIRFVVTRKGKLGLAPAITKVGDVIALVKGARAPFILRPWRASHRRYQNVGQAYIQHIMMGAALLEPSPDFMVVQIV